MSKLKLSSCWGFSLQAGEYLLNDQWIFNAGDHLDGAATFTAHLDVDIENRLETLRPGHGHAAFGRRFLLPLIGRFGVVAFAPLGRCHPRTVFAVGGEDTVEAGQVDSWHRDQGGELGDEV